MSFFAGLKRLSRVRRGSSMAEMMVAGGILAAGIVPLFGFWVKLTKDTGSVTSKARAFRSVQEAVDRYQAMGAAKLLGLAGSDGALGTPVDEARTFAAVATGGRFGAALMLESTGIAGSAAVAAAGAASAWTAAETTAPGASSSATKTQPPVRIAVKVTREEPLLRLVVESEEFPGLKVERLMPMPVEPAAPAWQ